MEWWQHGDQPNTELGFSIIKGSDLHVPPPTKDGLLNFLKKMTVYYARIMETAHLSNCELAGMAAHFFRFGTSRCVKKDQAKQRATDIFIGFNCTDDTSTPIILLGHGLREAKAHKGELWSRFQQHGEHGFRHADPAPL